MLSAVVVVRRALLPLLLLLLELLSPAVAVSDVVTGHFHPCDYSHLPGYWEFDAALGHRYRVWEPACHLHGLLKALRQHAASTPVAAAATAAGAAAGARGAAGAKAAAAGAAGRAARALLHSAAGASGSTGGARTARGAGSTGGPAGAASWLPGRSAQAAVSGSGGGAGAPTFSWGLLILGDTSHERLLALLCTELGGRVSETEPRNTHGPGNLRFCEAQNGGGRLLLDVGYMLLPGVRLAGPYHNNISGTPKERIDNSVRLFKDRFSGRGPSMVLLSANILDLATAVELEQGMMQDRTFQQLSTSEPFDPLTQAQADMLKMGLPQPYTLPRAFLDAYIANFTHLVHHTRTQLDKDAQLFYNTAPIFRHDYVTAYAEGPSMRHVGRATFQAELNAAGREACRHLRMHVIDLERMVRGFLHYEFLEGDVNTAGHILAELANIMLNLMAQISRYRSAAAAAVAATPNSTTQAAARGLLGGVAAALAGARRVHAWGMPTAAKAVSAGQGTKGHGPRTLPSATAATLGYSHGQGGAAGLAGQGGVPAASRALQAQGGVPAQSRGLQAQGLAASVPRPLCDYGRLPGYWDLTQEPGKRYQVWEPVCKVLNLVRRAPMRVEGPRGAGGAASPPTPPPAPPTENRPSQIGILMLGDSGSFRLLAAMCTGLTGAELVASEVANHTTRHEIWYCNHTKPEIIDLAYMLVPGVSQQGPYYGSTPMTPVERADLALRFFKQHWGRQPRVVVFNANLWDLARVCAKEDSVWQTKHWSELGVIPDFPFPDNIWIKLPTIHAYNHSYLEQWMANFTVLVDTVKAQLPQTTAYFYHTVPAFHHNQSTGYGRGHSQVRFGKIMFQAQLNSAGREASRRLGLNVIDLETMVAGFPPHMYLEDHYHVSQIVFMDVGNVLLNAALRLVGDK